MNGATSGSDSAGADVVARFWDRIEARDWAAVRDLLADDASLDYPVTGERFVGAEHILAINTEYPEGWTIDVRTLRGEGDDVLALVRVPLGDSIAWCTQRATVADGRIVAATEWWTAEGAEDAPDWRAPYRTDPNPPSVPNEDR